MEQNETAPHRVLLIDLDNCPGQINTLVQSMEQFARVIVCHGCMEPRVPLGLMMQLAPFVCAGRMEVIGMKRTGKNAADFGLTFHAGRLASELPPESEFVILSQDADLDHVIDLLRSMNRKAERINGKPTQVSSVIKLPTGLDADLERYIQITLHPKMARPAKRETLMRSIRTAFQARPDLRPENVLTTLLERGILRINSQGKVVYLDAEVEFQLDDGPIPF